jgi:hypothetical protein
MSKAFSNVQDNSANTGSGPAVPVTLTSSGKKNTVNNRVEYTNIYNTLDKDVAITAIKSQAGVSKFAIDANSDLASEVVSAAKLFGTRAATAQSETITASKDIAKSAYNFAAEASKTADERITQSVVKYAIWAAVALAALLILAPLLRKKKTEK